MSESKVAESSWVVQPIGKEHKLDEFDCGEEKLNEYLKRYALKNHKRNVSKAYVVTKSKTDRVAIGFYTLSAGSISFQNLPATASTGLPKSYPIPVALLGRMGITLEHQGTGLGTFLIADAMYRVLNAAAQIGTFALIVDAKNDSAKRFYKKFGFMEFSDKPLSLFLPVATIAQSLES